MESRSDGEELLTVVLSTASSNPVNGEESAPPAETSAILRIPSVSNLLGFETVSGVLREQFSFPSSSVTPRRQNTNQRTQNQASQNQGAVNEPRLSNEETSSEDDGEGEEGEDAEEEGEEGEMDGPMTIELRLLFRWLENNFPYLFLLFVFFLHQHKLGLLVFFWLTSVLFRINHAIKKQVALKEHRQPVVLAGLIAVLSIHILAVYFIFSRDQLWKSLLIVLTPPHLILTFWDVLWIVVLNDTMVRFGSMIAKCLCIIVVGHLQPQKRRKQLYGLIEMTSNMYRHFLPISVWFYFLYEGESNHTLACIMGGLYLSFKFTGLKEKVEVFISTLKAFMLHDAPYGKYASPEQVAEHGDSTCSICQDDMTLPIVLACNHMFCEECVSQWFEREKTCPICRAVVKTAGNHSYSDGGTSMIVQLF